MIRLFGLLNSIFILVYFFAPSSAIAEIAEDTELAGKVTIVKRVVQINESDCLKVFRGLSCEVKTGLPHLIGASLSIGPKIFTFTEGNQEQIQVEFTPTSTGYSLTVYPGSIDGPYLTYVKRSFKALPTQFDAMGLGILLDKNAE